MKYGLLEYGIAAAMIACGLWRPEAVATIGAALITIVLLAGRSQKDES